MLVSGRFCLPSIPCSKGFLAPQLQGTVKIQEFSPWENSRFGTFTAKELWGRSPDFKSLVSGDSRKFHDWMQDYEQWNVKSLWEDYYRHAKNAWLKIQYIFHRFIYITDMGPVTYHHIAPGIFIATFPGLYLYSLAIVQYSMRKFPGFRVQFGCIERWAEKIHPVDKVDHRNRLDVHRYNPLGKFNMAT